MATALLLPGMAQALDLAIPDVVVAEGQTMAVPINVSDAKGLAALQMRVEFDGGAIEVVDVVAGPALANALVDFTPGKGACTIAFAATDPVAGDGELLTLKLRRIGGATGGSALRPSSVRAWNGADGQAMNVSAHAGRVAPLKSTATDWRYVAAALAGLAAAGLAAAGAIAFVARRRLRASPARPAPTPASSGSPNFCAMCGAPLPQGANFCPNCGTKIAHA